MFKLDRDSFQKILQTEAQKASNLTFQSKQKEQITFSEKQKNKQPEVNLPLKNSTFVAVPAHALPDVLQIYQWRSQTEYPIVKAHTTGTILNKTLSVINLNLYPQNYFQELFKPEEKLYLEVITQSVQLLSNFGPLPLGTFTYAFKESIVGFQRLYGMFGPFTINSSMIAVNNEGHVKVWLSSHYHQNTKNQFNLVGKNYQQNLQKPIVSQLKQVFLSFSQNNASFREFFAFIQHTDSFLTLLKKIWEFISFKRILVTHSIRKQTPKQIKRPLSPNFRLIPANKVPRFISPPQNIIFKKRQTIGEGVNQEKLIKNLIQMKNLNVIISQLQTKQSLSSKSQLISNNLANQDRSKFSSAVKNNQVKTSLGEREASSKRKKLDSLEKNMQNLFENQTENKQQPQSSIFRGLSAYGKAIKRSRYIEGQCSPES